jgi:hypothetical protein
MFRKFLLGAAAFVAGTAVVAYAGPKEDVQDAVKKLAAAPNYSWHNTSEGGQFNTSSEGKKDGEVTWTKTTFGDNEFESIRMGDKVVNKRGGEDWAAPDPNGGGGRRGGFGRGGGQAPAAQAEQALTNIPEFTKQGDVYTANLTGDAIRGLMQFGRGGGRRGGGDAGANQGPQITNGKATYKVTIKEGIPVKFESHISGSMNFNGNDIDLDRTTVTEIKDVGKTKINIPADAKAKLQG